MNLIEVFKVCTQKHTEFVYIFKNNTGLFFILITKDVHKLNIFIIDLYDLNGRYCSKEKCHFQSVVRHCVFFFFWEIQTPKFRV
jgi:hypothetical protein